MQRIPLSWGHLMGLQPQPARSATDVVQLFVARYVPLYSRKTSLAEQFKRPWSSPAKKFHLEDDGFMPVHGANPKRVRRVANDRIETVRERSEFCLSKANQEALERIAALAQKHGFDVYLANAPIYEGLFENQEFKGYLAQVHASLDAFVSQSPRMHYVLREPMTFPADQMENPDHLIYSAALVYTDSLVSEIISLQDSTN